MSKKLIAVASAAALALSALVAAPAYAAFSVTPTGEVADGGATAATAATINVPSQDVMRFQTVGGASSTIIRLTVATTSSGSSVTAVATGGARLLTTTQTAAATTTHKTGVTSLTQVSDGNSSAVFDVYTTSTTAASVTITEGANASVFWVKGVTAAANAYNMAFTAPTATSPAGAIEFTGTVKDMFGNNVTGATFTVAAVGGNLLAGPTATATQDATTGVYTFELTNRNTAGAAAFSVSVDSPAAEKKAAFGAQTVDQFFSVTAQDLSARVKLLEGQVATLQAIVDRKVTKKRYNTLARKWNAAFPSQKVALKK